MTNPATPSTPLGNPSQVTPSAPVSRAGQATGQPPAQPQLKVATTLLITDGTSGQTKLKDIVTKYTQQYLPVGAEIKAVTSWQALYSLLAEYDTIDTLIIYLHGSAGMVGIGSSQKDLGVVISEIQATGKHIPAVRQHLQFEFCNVGRGPLQTSKFAKMLQAPDVSAWTHFHAVGYVSFNITATTTHAQVEQALADYQGYLMDGTPSAATIASTPGTRLVFYEWFQESEDVQSLPPAPKAGELDSRQRDFVPRSGTVERPITSAQAKELDDEYQGLLLRPEHVTITIVP
jgi:hypothetical protein